jgi:hypothetical protein
MYYLQFMTKYFHKNKTNVIYENKQIINTYSTKFLGLFIPSSLSWNKQSVQLVLRLNTACYAICSVKHFATPETIRKFYFFHIYSILIHARDFVGNSHSFDNNFKVQKKLEFLLFQEI